MQQPYQLGPQIIEQQFVSALNEPLPQTRILHKRSGKLDTGQAESEMPQIALLPAERHF